MWLQPWCEDFWLQIALMNESIDRYMECKKSGTLRNFSSAPHHPRSMGVYKVLVWNGVTFRAWSAESCGGRISMYGSVSDVRGNAGAPSSVSCSGRSGSDATRCHGVQVQMGAVWVPSLCHHCLDLFGSLPLVIEFVYIVSELFILHLIVCRSKVCPMIPVCSSKPSHVRNRLRKRKGCSISIGFNAL